MRGFGEIARLCEVALPTIGVVTSVASSHTERVGGIDGVAIAERELVEALSDTGTAILNADDERVAAMGDHARASVITYGVAGDVRISAIELDELARPSFHVDSPWGSGHVRLGRQWTAHGVERRCRVAVAGVIEGRDRRSPRGLGDRRSVGDADGGQPGRQRGGDRERRLQRQSRLDAGSAGGAQPDRRRSAGRRVGRDGRARRPGRRLTSG